MYEGVEEAHVEACKRLPLLIRASKYLLVGAAVAMARSGPAVGEGGVPEGEGDSG